MDIMWRRTPQGAIEVFYGGTWQATDQAWLDARARAGHNIVEQQPSPGTQVNRDLTRIFAPDGATISPEGSILGRPAPRQAVATQQTPNPRVFAPDGAQLSPEGSILSLSAPPANRVEATRAMLPQPPERGNNPGAVLNADGTAWNVDSGANWDYSGRPPAAAAAPVVRRPVQTLEGEQGYQDYLNAAANPSDVERFYTRLGAYATGGMHQSGDMALPPDPNAIVGEGLEQDHPQIDDPNPYRGEVVAVPTGKGVNNYDLYHTEGPVAMTLPDRAMIWPMTQETESMSRDNLPPIEAMPQPKSSGPNGAGAKSPGGAPGEMQLPTMQEFATGGQMYGREFSQFDQRPGGLFAPSLWLDPWQGMQRRDFGSLRGYNQASEGEVNRRNQLLVLGGAYGGAEAEQNYYRQHAPKPMALPVYAG